MPWYRNEGKILTPLTDREFSEGMEQGHFVQPSHRAYCVLLYYSAVRKTEASRVLREQLQITRTNLVFEVGKRLKHGMVTPPLSLPLAAKYMPLLRDAVEATPSHQRVFPYSPKTCYNIVHRAGFKYPHLARLSRITNFFLEGWTIAQVHSWTGLSLSALNYYVGLVDIARMGASLAKGRTEQT
jgi:hypothetical protein